jgi:N-acetylglucosamine kinase-like BadF-type ATPase
MLLIADSGSSKTDWRLIFPDGQVRPAGSAGFNPYFQTSEEIYTEILRELPPQLGTLGVREIYFYGAGCSTDKNRNIVQEGLGKLFPAASIHVSHDLLAAARALCGREPGIACILGTGVNSCQYDGQGITEGRPSLGFWLGDEGGGGYLGRTLVQHYFHEEMPADVRQQFAGVYQLVLGTVLENAYKKPFPNSYFAAFSRFLSDRLDHPYCRQLVYDGFSLFFERYVRKYTGSKQYPVHFTGSVAHHYRDILQTVAHDKGLRLGNVLKNPIDGLIAYHKGSS